MRRVIFYLFSIEDQARAGKSGAGTGIVHCSVFIHGVSGKFSSVHIHWSRDVPVPLSDRAGFCDYDRGDNAYVGGEAAQDFLGSADAGNRGGIFCDISCKLRNDFELGLAPRRVLAKELDIKKFPNSGNFFYA